MPRLLDPGPSERGWHRIQNALRCLRLYALSASGELDEFPLSAPLVRGSLLHVALAHYYKRLQCTQKGLDPEEWFEPIAAVQHVALTKGKESPLWDAWVGPVTNAYLEYVENFGAQDERNWEILEVEEELRALLGPEKKLYTQRADLIVKDREGRVWIVDHKTAFRLTAKTLDQHILDGQFLGYQHFGRARWGRAFRGVVVNRIKISDPVGFDRRVLEPAPAALADFVATVLHGETEIARHKGRPPRKWPGIFNSLSCYNKYGKCPAFDLCRFGVDP
jgi:hypothetical protein